MIGAREPIYLALFALLAASANYKTASRKLRHYTQVDPAARPALFMVDHNENTAQPGRGIPSKTTLSVDVYVYISSADPNASGSTILNPLLDAIDAAIAPSPVTNVQTLGGLVSHCWVDGDVLKDPGDLDQNGVALIPIKMLVP